MIKILREKKEFRETRGGMKKTDIYRNLSRFYDEKWGDWHKLHIPVLCRLLESRCPPVSRILDLGCGTGALVEHLCSRGHRAEGIDVSPEMIEIAKKRDVQGSPFRVQNLCRFSTDQKYDLVTCTFHTLNYQEKSLLDDLFFSVSMALNMGGVFLFDSYTEHQLRKNHHGSVKHTSGSGPFIEERSYSQKARTALTRFRFPDGSEELHKQYPYGLTDVLSSIMNAGLYVLYSYGGFNEEPYTAESEQLVCVVAKPSPETKARG
ncbi:MAG: class I SAM-dependent DNA methyltransferase [Chitinispirillaceae bacterium]